MELKAKYSKEDGCLSIYCGKTFVAEVWVSGGSISFIDMTDRHNTEVELMTVEQSGAISHSLKV